MKDRRIEPLQRQVTGLLEMNRQAKERLAELESRCARLEQALLETSRRLPSPARVTLWR